MASLTVAADPAIVSERKAGHEHDAYSEGIVLIFVLAAVAMPLFLVFLDMAIIYTVTPTITGSSSTRSPTSAGTQEPISGPAPPARP